MLWSTVRPPLSLSSEKEQKSAVGPHIAPIVWGISAVRSIDFRYPGLVVRLGELILIISLSAQY